MLAWRPLPHVRILFFKATFRNQPGYALRGPHGKRRWRKMNMERNIHYDLDLVEIENSVRVTGDDSARTATATLPPVRAESALSIADLLRGATRDSDHQPFTP